MPAPKSASFQPRNVNSGILNHCEGLLRTSFKGSKLIIDPASPLGIRPIKILAI